MKNKNGELHMSNIVESDNDCLDIDASGDNVNEITPEDIIKRSTAEDRKVYEEVDRDQEDKDVDRYQKTHDEELFNKIYRVRIPTLQIWARKFRYLTDNNIDDMYGEICVYFMKAVQKYNYGRGRFNTCLFTFLINHMRNLITSKRAKKRLPKGMSPDAIKNFMLSLDYSYNNKDGEGNTLKDIIANKIIDNNDPVDDLNIKETVNKLAGNNQTIAGFMKRLSDGETIASLIKLSKIKKGEIRISHCQASKLKSNRKHRVAVKHMIEKSLGLGSKFSVIDYHVSSPKTLSYTIEMRKSKEADLLMKTIRRLRKNKNLIIKKLEQ